MIEMKKSALAAAVVASMGIGGMQSVNAAPITAFRITGGSFAMGFFTPGGPLPFTSTSNADLAQGYVAPAWDVNASQPGPQAGSIMSFNFGGPYVNYYSATTNGSPQGVSGGGPVVNGTFGGGSITVDLSSLYANWNATDFAQGSTATGTTSGGTSFSVAWKRLIVGGPFNGQTGTYVATGSLTAVPVPAAAWLMGSGLIGLAGVARRRKQRS